MIGKVVLKRVGGYDPKLGRANRDPSLEVAPHPRRGKRLSDIDQLVLEMNQLSESIKAVRGRVARLWASAAGPHGDEKLRDAIRRLRSEAAAL